MKYLSVKEAAEIWNISERMVRKYCEQDRIEGLIQAENIWVIPALAKRPTEIKVEEKPLTAFAKPSGRALASCIPAGWCFCPRLAKTKLCFPLFSEYQSPAY